MEGDIQATGQKSFLIKVTLKKQLNAKYNELYDHLPQYEDYITEVFNVGLNTNEAKQLWVYEKIIDVQQQHKNEYIGEQVNDPANFYNQELNSKEFKGLLIVIRFQNKQDKNIVTFKAKLPYIVVNSKYMDGYQLKVEDRINFGRSCAIVKQLDRQTPSFSLSAQSEPTVETFIVGPDNGLIMGRKSEAEPIKITQFAPDDLQYAMLNDKTVSRNHAKVQFINNQFWISDYQQTLKNKKLRSKYGVLVHYKNNSQHQIKERPIGIQIGNILLEIQ